MYQTIHEKIAVAGIYNQAIFTPKKLKWRNKVLLVQQTTFIANIKDGGTKKRMYSVVCEGMLYRICFDRDAETWMLEEVWYDG
jgi:hypothetical protein